MSGNSHSVATIAKEEKGMADPKQVEEKNGVFKTNAVNLEPGHTKHPDYEILLFPETEQSRTGLIRVMSIVPSRGQAGAPRFIGRWDEKAASLDFDFADADDNPVSGPKPVGHHTKPLGDQRFEVELGPEVREIVFRGVVSLGLGFRMRLRGDALRLTGQLAIVVNSTPPDGASKETR